MINGKDLVILGTSGSSPFLFLERFPLRLKVLDHHVPQDVRSGDALSGGLIVSYYVTRGEESLLGIFSKDEGYFWDCCPSWASETVCDLLYGIFIKLH